MNAQLNVREDKLETTVALERKASEEKIALLNRMTEELRESFQALSADALKSNNQAFLQLANATLEKFQSEAKGDLELRQQAVENLVAPIGESLKKVDEQIRQMESSARPGIRRSHEPGPVTDYHAGKTAERDREPGEGAAHAHGPRAVGRNSAQARGGDRRHAARIAILWSRRR